MAEPSQSVISNPIRSSRRRPGGGGQATFGVAHDDGVPPYIILTNRQCLDIARGSPRTLEGLGQIKGIGKKKIKKHGLMILEEMTSTAYQKSKLTKLKRADDRLSRLRQEMLG